MSSRGVSSVLSEAEAICNVLELDDGCTSPLQRGVRRAMWKLQQVQNPSLPRNVPTQSTRAVAPSTALITMSQPATSIPPLPTVLRLLSCTLPFIAFSTALRLFAHIWDLLSQSNSQPSISKPKVDSCDDSDHHPDQSPPLHGSRVSSETITP